jgi:hypothetical protein
MITSNPQIFELKCLFVMWITFIILIEIQLTIDTNWIILISESRPHSLVIHCHHSKSLKWIEVQVLIQFSSLFMIPSLRSSVTSQIAFWCQIVTTTVIVTKTVLPENHFHLHSLTFFPISNQFKLRRSLHNRYPKRLHRIPPIEKTDTLHFINCPNLTSFNSLFITN